MQTLSTGQLLDQFGIQCYVPTRPLPSALAAPIRVKPKMKPSASAAKLSEKQPVAPIPINQLLEVADKEKDKKVPQVPRQPFQAVSQDYSANLMAWRVGDCLCIDSVTKEQALPTERLLFNILRALGINIVQLPAPQFLQWPMVKQRFDKQGEPKQQACDRVQAYVLAQTERSPLQAVLAFGETAAELTLGQFNAWTTLQNTQSSLGQLPIYVLDSLSDLLTTPSLKARTWSCIRPLAIANTSI